MTVVDHVVPSVKGRKPLDSLVSRHFAHVSDRTFCRHTSIYRRLAKEAA